MAQSTAAACWLVNNRRWARASTSWATASAVGGVLAKYAAPSNATTATLVGAGVIGRTMVSAIHEALPQIKTMYLCDIDVAKAEGIAKEYGDSLGVEIVPTSDSKAAALKSQLIVGETTAPKPFMDTSWLTPGCGLVSMHSNEVMEDVFLKADGIVADYWTQLKQHTNPLSKLTKEGKLDESQIMDLSELVLGTKKLRTSDDQFVVDTFVAPDAELRQVDSFAACGQRVIPLFVQFRQSGCHAEHLPFVELTAGEGIPPQPALHIAVGADVREAENQFLGMPAEPVADPFRFA